VRTIPRVPVSLAAVVIVSAGLLAGCGVADGGARPGVAAEVGDTTIRLADVDDVAQELCDAYSEDPEVEGNPVSGAEVRKRALQTLVLRAIADGVAEDRGIEPSPTFESLEAEAEEVGTVRARQLLGITYFVNVMTEVGRLETGSSASEQEQLTAGIEIAQEWTAEEGLRTNPVFPDISIGDEAVEFSRDELSVAVSEFAESALADADRFEQQQQQADTAYVQSLPESQRCG
jgi:SurA-like protein